MCLDFSFFHEKHYIGPVVSVKTNPPSQVEGLIIQIPITEISTGPQGKHVASYLLFCGPQKDLSQLHNKTSRGSCTQDWYEKGMAACPQRLYITWLHVTWDDLSE